MMSKQTRVSGMSSMRAGLMSIGMIVSAARSVARVAVQLGLEAVGRDEADIDGLAVERERPELGFAVAENPALDREGARVQPAPLDGIDAVARRRAQAKDPVEPHHPGEPFRRLVGFRGR